MNNDSHLARTLEHLRALVGFDTTNPPRAIEARGGIFGYVEELLSGCGFQIEIFDLGDGCISLYARRGAPDLLFNNHLDTVPADQGYSADPFTLRVDKERAVGLGSCDIKGAAACLLTAAEKTTGPAAILFTSDEEAGSSRCVREFCRLAPHPYKAVFIAEPTGAQAVVGHRGIRTFTGHFNGTSGHSSGPDALENSALHHAARWVSAAVGQAEEDRRTMTYQALRGTCFNVGVIDGGKKPNIVASRARVRWGIRPLPGQDAGELATHYFDLVGDPDRVRWEDGFCGPSLPAHSGEKGEAQVQRAIEVADEAKIEIADPVDFWTEAAIFSEAGWPSIVFGPGDIAQAHTADEWVSLNDLQAMTDHYRRLLSTGRT